MNDRLIGILIAIMLSAIAFIIRKERAINLLDKIDKKPSHREKIMEELVTIYRKINISEFPDLFDLVMKIPDNQQLNKYIILRKFQINENKLLIFTKCVDNDIKVSKFGIKSDMMVVYQFNFVIKQNHQKAQYEFYSDLFENLNTKNLRSDFKDELLKYLKTAQLLTLNF